MKRILLACLLAAVCSTGVLAQIKIGNRTLDTKKVLVAASDVAKAVTLSDEDIASLSRESVAWMDKNNKVSEPESEYTQRLNRITEKFGEVEGLKLNFKVYEVIDVNAFACGDGSIRVFSALMDLMDDDELAAIIGHEIGHVVHTDAKDAMKNAYLTSAALECCGGDRRNGCEIERFGSGKIGGSFYRERSFRKSRSMKPMIMPLIFV